MDEQNPREQEPMEDRDDDNLVDRSEDAEEFEDIEDKKEDEEDSDEE
jgi:hypothetical protein